MMLALFGAPGKAMAHKDAPNVAAGQTAYALGGLLSSTKKSASLAQAAQFHSLLLDCPADLETDRRFGMRPLVKQQTAKWSPRFRARIVNWLDKHPLPVTHLTAVALTLYGPAPEFSGIAEAEVTGLTENWSDEDRSELGRLLREGWAEGGLGALWTKLLPVWQKSQPSPGRVSRALEKTRRFLRLPIDAPLSLRYVSVDPLLPVGAALSNMFSASDVGIILGPSASAEHQETLLVHELLHPLLNFFLAHNPRAKNSLMLASCVFQAAKRDKQAAFAATRVYPQWDVYFTETAVRVLSHRIAKTQIDRDGFLLAEGFDWELDRFEVEHFGFETLWTRALGRLTGVYCPSEGAQSASLTRVKALPAYSRARPVASAAFAPPS